MKRGLIVLPIVTRELRVAARRPGPYWMRFAAAAMGFAVVLLLGEGIYGQVAPPQLSRTLFHTLAVCTCLYGVFAGVFLTADSLSSEKREGTLGLLFLTDLKGHDVVLGKLAATSVSSIYAVVAVFPALAVPLLMGGVSAAQFLRTVLALLVVQWLSLAIGLFVSSLGRESGRVLLVSFLVVLVLTVGLPLVHLPLAFLMGKYTLTKWMLLACPLNTVLQAAQPSGTAVFWMAVGLQAAAALFLIVQASLHLPRALDNSTPGMPAAAGLARSVESVSPPVIGASQAAPQNRPLSENVLTRSPLSDPHGRVALDENPYYWLIKRERRFERLSYGVMGVGLLGWALLVFSSMSVGSGFMRSVSTGFALGLAYILHGVFKCIVAVEASRRFSADRQSGCWEALLSTPLSADAIVEGHRRGLWERFRPLLIALALMNATLLAVPALNDSGFDDTELLVALMLVGGIAALFLDFYGLIYHGAKMGLVKGKHHFAVWATIAPILLLPWVIVPVPGILCLAAGWDMAFLVLIPWLMGGLALSAAMGTSARDSLLSSLRQLASGDPAPPAPGLS